MDTWYTQFMPQAKPAAESGQNWFNLPTVDDSSVSSDFQKLLDDKSQDVERPKTSKKPQSNSEQKESSKTESKDQGTKTENKTEKKDEKDTQIVENPQASVYQSNMVIVGHVEDDGTTQEILGFTFDEETGTWDRTMIEIQGRFVFPESSVQGQIESVGVQPQVTVPQAEAPLQMEVPQTEVPQMEEQTAVDLPEAVQTTAQPVQQETEAPQTQTVVQKAEVQNAAQGAEEDEVVADVSTEAQPLFHDVKAAPIKVAEAPAAEQTEEVDVGEQLLDPLTQALQQGDSRVTVRLTPETLGTVDVQITQTADGALHVALTAASSETRGLLEKHAANLQLMLASRNQDNTVQVEVQRHEESQQGQNHSYEGHGENQSRRQQEQQQQNHSKSSDDFLQQLRLGLIPLDVEAT